MALDRHAKLELLVRTAFRNFWLEKLSSAKQKAVIIPGFEIPRGGNVDLVLGPKSGTAICFMQRSDYVAAFKHTVGQIIGLLVHYHQMTDREVREALRNIQSRTEVGELHPITFDVLKVSKRLLEDIKEGNLTVALVTELPEVPQQGKELQTNFYPIASLLQTWLPTPVKKKKLCDALEFYAVDPNTDPPKVMILEEALAPLLKSPA
jgi:hypothetical protein